MTLEERAKAIAACPDTPEGRALLFALVKPLTQGAVTMGR